MWSALLSFALELKFYFARDKGLLAEQLKLNKILLSLDRPLKALAGQQ